VLTCNDASVSAITQEFLYDIVNNTRTGLDVDKLDYFVRDSTCCGVGTVPEIGRFFDLARSVLQTIGFTVVP
jgi:HD superfamily phosphohydrolase